MNEQQKNILYTAAHYTSMSEWLWLEKCCFLVVRKLGFRFGSSENSKETIAGDVLNVQIQTPATMFPKWLERQCFQNLVYTKFGKHCRWVVWNVGYWDLIAFQRGPSFKSSLVTSNSQLPNAQNKAKKSFGQGCLNDQTNETSRLFWSKCGKEKRFAAEKFESEHVIILKAVGPQRSHPNSWHLFSPFPFSQQQLEQSDTINSIDACPTWRVQFGCDGHDSFWESHNRYFKGNRVKTEHHVVFKSE